MAIGDRLRNIKPWSNDEDDTRSNKPSPNFHNTTGNSHCSPIRGLLAKDLEILKADQVTRMRLGLSPISPNYSTTPMGGRTFEISTDSTYITPLNGGCSAVAKIVKVQ
ncbi:hypothetical protein TNCV_1377101 [Trichonephila clavipes]|nr:hypothetical protein TNCV_1377101 [Trichonephila clavipes]